MAMVALIAWPYLLGVSFSWAVLGTSCVLATICIVSRRFPVEFGFGKTWFEVADVAILVALVLGGPLCALLVAVPAMLHREWLHTIFDGATLVTQVLVAAWVLGWFSEPLLFGSQFDASFVYGVVGAGLTFYLLDTLIGPVLLRIKYGTPVSRLVQEVALPPIPSDAVAILTTLVTAYAAVEFGPATALTLFCGAALSLALMIFIRERQKKFAELGAEVSRLRESNAELERGLASSNVAFASRIVQNLGRKDGYTAAHAAASVVYAGDLAAELGLDPARAEKLKAATLLQDVGLVGVPDDVLLTPPKKLNSVGRMHLEEHAERGEHVLAGIPGFEEAAKWVRWHHERIDGTGFPDRIRGEWIPLEARILAVAASYATLVLDGPHSPGLSPLDARLRLTGAAGTALDRQVVRTLLMVLDTKDESYASAADARFAFPDSAKQGHGAATAPLRAIDSAKRSESA